MAPVDYEFRIISAEKELEHLREMQKLHASRLDINDTRSDMLQEIVLRTATTVDKLAIKIDVLATKMDVWRPRWMF